MHNPLFSSYHTGENRVTSTTMAVFERIDFDLVHELLETAAQIGGELPAVDFVNQPNGAKGTPDDTASVPDACISGSFAWWFETKIVRGVYADSAWRPTPAQCQVKKHAANLAGRPEAFLFVITPDAARPAWFGGNGADARTDNALDGIEEAVRARIVWLSFSGIADAIEGLIRDPTRLIAEQTRLLLTELISFYDAEGLLTTDDTVVVAARVAWAEYLKYGAYVGHPHTAYREGTTHFGFYCNGKIESEVPRIEQWHPAVVFSRDEAASWRAAGNPALADLIERMLDDGVREDGAVHGVMQLTATNDDATCTLAKPILNDTVTASGRPWAWTLGRRYTRLRALCSGATYTSELGKTT